MTSAFTCMKNSRPRPKELTFSEAPNQLVTEFSIQLEIAPWLQLDCAEEPRALVNVAVAQLESAAVVQLVRDAALQLGVSPLVKAPSALKRLLLDGVQAILESSSLAPWLSSL